MKSVSMVFFGSEPLAGGVLDELASAGLMPSLVVTGPDVPKGRKHILTPPEAKAWAEAHGVPALQPTSLKDEDQVAPLLNTDWDLFIVASYGKILPKRLLALPKHGTLNVHPSLLPLLRGPSPIRTAILTDARETGVSVMLMDQEVDHGPILAQARIEIAPEDWPMRATMLEALLAHAGGQLLAETVPLWLDGTITPEQQDHAQATFSKKIEKEDGRLDLADDPYQNLLKIRAYDGWPGTYFMHERNGKQLRVKVTDADLAPDGSLRILRVIPEGKKEMNYEDFLRGE
ncbi:methionyl-tRNA formyltransferase [Candidatus Kaiserbacteria bacterium]|nr:methionyl-tRNA formyltransferase [Candidatus Kaiserbacteria bacterium]